MGSVYDPPSQIIDTKGHVDETKSLVIEDIETPNEQKTLRKWFGQSIYCSITEKTLTLVRR
jgi:hypothetical protein